MRSNCISKIWCSFATHEKKSWHSCCSRDHWNPRRLVGRPPRLAVSIRIDDDLRRLLSEAREDVIRTPGLSSSRSSWESCCWDVQGDNATTATTGCGWLLHSPFLVFFGWWVFSGVCFFLVHTPWEVLMTCVCVCCFFCPPLTSILKKERFLRENGT